MTLTTVPAEHANGIAGNLIGGKLGEMLNAAGVTASAGPPTGYVMTFSNGLVAYLSGDTGITAEQDTVVREHYGAELAVINIGDTFTTGPKEAAIPCSRTLGRQPERPGVCTRVLSRIFLTSVLPVRSGTQQQPPTHRPLKPSNSPIWKVDLQIAMRPKGRG